MYQSDRIRGLLPGLLTAAAIVGLVWASGPAHGQNPPAASQFYIALPVSAKDTKHEAAVKKATEYLEGLKDNKQNQTQEAARTKDRLPPDFPGEKGTEPSAAAGPGDIAAAAAVPPFGPAGALITALTQNRPVPPAAAGYRWVRLGDRELYPLGLDATAKGDPTTKATYEAAAKARADGKVYVHKDFNWLIYSREAAGGAIDYYTLVHLPPGAERITERDLGTIRHRTPQETPNPNVEIVFAETDRIKTFTGKYKKGDSKSGDDGVIVLVVDNDAVRVIQLTNQINNGVMAVAARLASEERERIHKTLMSAVRRQTSGQ